MRADSHQVQQCEEGITARRRPGTIVSSCADPSDRGRSALVEQQRFARAAGRRRSPPSVSCRARARPAALLLARQLEFGQQLPARGSASRTRRAAPSAAVSITVRYSNSCGSSAMNASRRFASTAPSRCRAADGDVPRRRLDADDGTERRGLAGAVRPMRPTTSPGPHGRRSRRPP